VGGPAGDLIVDVATAMFNGIGLSKLGGCVHPYPTYVEAFRGMADAYNRTKLRPTA
jgi:pyruvate/2-oxoglutarate dehydrogenase complex dihydrolipoamide dehydrogenase (E3) component